MPLGSHSSDKSLLLGCIVIHEKECSLYIVGGKDVKHARRDRNARSVIKGQVNRAAACVGYNDTNFS